MFKITWQIVWFTIKLLGFSFFLFFCGFCSFSLGVAVKMDTSQSNNNKEYMPTNMITRPLNNIHYIAGSTQSATGTGTIQIGDKFDGYYYGRDYVRPMGTPIYAPYNGTLSFQQDIGGGTPQITIVSLDGREKTHIMHLNTAKTSGDVLAGELIGTTGANGKYSGGTAHEHISFYIDGRLADWDTSGYSYETSVFTPVTKAIDGLYDSGQYNSLINKYSIKYRLDSKLVHAIIRQESAYDKNAVSPAGAVGLMQIMPITKSDQCPLADLYDPEQNIACGTKHLRWTFDQMGDDEKKGIMAYHSGVTAQKTRGATSLDVFYYEQIMRYYND